MRPIAVCLALVAGLPSAMAQADRRDLPAPTAAPYGDVATRTDPILLAGSRIEWREISPAETGALHLPGISTPARRWRLDGSVADSFSTERLPVTGEALAAIGQGSIAVAFFVPEKSFRRFVRSKTKDSRRGWAVLKRNRPAELGSGQVSSWFSPMAFQYDYTLLRISLPDGKHVCTAFHGTRAAGGSYSGSVGGYLCAPPGVDLDTARVTAFLGGIEVGFGAGEGDHEVASWFAGTRPHPSGVEPGPAATEAHASSASRPSSRKEPSPPLAATTDSRSLAAPEVIRASPLRDKGRDRSSDGPVVDRPAPTQPAGVSRADEAPSPDACAPYLGDPAMSLRCQWLTGPDRTTYIPSSGRDAPLAVQMRCHPLREEATRYAVCVARG